MRIVYEKVYICRHINLPGIAKILLGPEPKSMESVVALILVQMKGSN
jgi:hypothetical protein